MEPKVGQVWKENDNRFTREIEIISIDGLRVKIKTIMQIVSGKDYCTGKITNANIKRFNGKHMGYTYLRN